VKVGRWVMCSVVPQRLAVLRDALGCGSAEDESIARTTLAPSPAST